jgi:hypothetical protein
VTHADDMAKLTSELDRLEKGNEELVETLHDAKLRARSEVSEREKQLERLMYEKAELDREKCAQTSATLQKLRCEYDTKLAKKKSLQRELETLSESRRSREAVIEQLRLRYEESEAQIQEQARDIRRVRKRQKHELDRLKQELIDAKQTEKAYKLRLEELRMSQFRDGEGFRRSQEQIAQHGETLDAELAKLRAKTETSVAKLRDAERILSELMAKEEELKQRAKSASEELHRQHNEALRAKQMLDAKRSAMTDIKGQIAKIRAEHKERFANPRVSVIEVPPRATMSVPSDGDLPSEFGIITANPDLFALSPISSGNPNSGEFANGNMIAELKAQLEEVKKTAQDFQQYLRMKRAEVAAMKAEGSEYDRLRKENELLKAQKAEMDEMKAEINKLRQGRTGI